MSRNAIRFSGISPAYKILRDAKVLFITVCSSNTIGGIRPDVIANAWIQAGYGTVITPYSLTITGFIVYNVGNWLVAKHTPRVLTFAPPSADISPPQVIEVAVILVAKAVDKVGNSLVYLIKSI